MRNNTSSSRSSSAGFSLVETVVSIAILTTGVLGTLDVLTRGMMTLTSSSGDVVSTEKASEAIEGVFAARDSHKLTWSQIRNVHGASGSDGGVFLDGPQSLRDAGADGVVNTADDGAIEQVVYPGPDQLIGTSDDVTITLSNYTREIQIRDVPNENGNLRSVTVIITYTAKTGQQRTYSVMTYISNYS